MLWILYILYEHICKEIQVKQDVMVLKAKFLATEIEREVQHGHVQALSSLLLLTTLLCLSIGQQMPQSKAWSPYELSRDAISSMV